MSKENDLMAFLEAASKEIPNLNRVLESVRAGEQSEEDAVLSLMMDLKSTGGLERIQEAAVEHLDLDPGVFEDEDMAGRSEHALHLAAISERLQFDGDIPELRTGPMPDGASPAVEVESEARSLAVLGAMLATASEEVAREIEAYREKVHRDAENGSNLPARADLQEAVARGLRHLLPEGNPVHQARVLSALVGREVQPDELVTWDPPSYRRQTRPPARRVDAPSGAELARMSPAQRARNAWQALSTTQGRRSAAPTVAALVEDRLRQRGYEITRRATGVSAGVSWTCSIDDGAPSTQPGFSFVDTAAAALATKIMQRHAPDDGPHVLSVSTVDSLAEREVGWAAQLEKADEEATDLRTERGTALLAEP